MNPIRCILAAIFLAAFSVAGAQDCSGIAGDWQGTWSETDCFGDPYAGEWMGEITAACEFTAINSWGNVTGTIAPATGVLTATMQGAECGTLSLTGTFADGEASGSWTYSGGGGGQFTGEQQITDSDGDGVPDNEDAFPNDPNEWADSDGDGVGDNGDAFPNDPNETTDSDGDGVGDNADEFPNDPTETTDSDGDGVGDNADAFPNDPSETTDTDGDGIGDNSDPDIDGDGVPNEQDDYPFGRFDDAPPGYWAFTFIEALARSGITAGCGGDNYCPTAPVTRAQMAVFLERGINGSNYSPPAATGNVFNDVGAGDFAAAWIEQLFSDGITAGCGNNNYCPNADVTRAQMAVFLLRAKYGAGHSPPAATGVFNDVDLSYWAVAWIEQLAAEGITAGCGNGNYCPDARVTRDQMAVFLVRTFGL